MKNRHIIGNIYKKRRETVNSITRLDDKGALYSMEYSANYYTPIPKMVPGITKLFAKTGCTCFTTRDERGNFIHCRCYDYPHLYKGELTGCNVAIKCTPKKGYRSIAFADAALMLEIKIPYITGSLDNGKTDTSFALSFPWICPDGMNEMGLCASVVSVDLREGEKPTYQKDRGKEKLIILALLRYILDYCKDVDEAITMAKSKNLVNTAGHTYQLFVSDKTGRSVTIEWAGNDMFVVETNAAANFHQSADDASDYYKNGKLKEAWTGPADTKKKYHYGCGHGYERFKKVVSVLDNKDYFTAEEAKELLFSVKQRYVEQGDSDTRYGVVYNLNDFTAKVWLPSDETKCYEIK